MNQDDIRFLSSADLAALMPSEAECIAIDRSYALAKQSGVLDRLDAYRELRQQQNELRQRGEIV